MTSTTQSPHKLRVGILYGGQSSEHEISLLTASSIIQHLDPNHFTVVPIYLDRQGNWHHAPLTTQAERLQSPQHLLKDSSDTSVFFSPNTLKQARISTETISPPLALDVIFPAVHGTLCEDGTLQGLLEQAGIAYVGCGVLASAICMDKDVAKRVARDAGVPVGPFFAFKQRQWEKNAADILTTLQQTLRFPVFVKPANNGSSVGITKVASPETLQAAIHEALQYDTKVIVEQGINAFELEVAVLESPTDPSQPITSVVGEIQANHQHEFYSYAAKYVDEHGAALMIPSQNAKDSICQQAQALARKIFIALDCEGMARVDLFLDRDTQQLYFNEINSLPGFTSISMYPKLMAASGIVYTELLTRLIHLALQRHQEKNKLQRQFILHTATIEEK